MGQTLSTNEVYPLKGELPRVELPIAASQNLTLFEPVYLVNGQVTRWLAANSHGTASQPFFGWIGSVTTKTINGVTTSLPAGTLVSVIPAHKDVCWALPTYGQAPTVANIASGANTAGFQVFYDGSRYYVDLTTTSNPVARPYSFDQGDEAANTGAQIWKATPVVGDRFLCAILPAAKQVDF